ncbi:MAG: L,D-transpeptidase [Verrucomicrobiae bacterium]|nr:L,D-transpeptidase [Verrucomicrobiae bacterium]
MQQLFDQFRSSPAEPPQVAILVSVDRQRLVLCRPGLPPLEWPVSTSKFGVGNQQGSYCTPTGLHRIAEKIGRGMPLNTVFKNRLPVEPPPIGDPQSNTSYDLGDDLIMSRILWLTGCEPGINQGGNVDSHDRYIYIHGTNQEERIGTPASHGCIRMRRADVAELFEMVEVGTPVMIR